MGVEYFGFWFWKKLLNLTNIVGQIETQIMVILVECSAQGGFSLWSKKIQPSQKVLILKLSPLRGADEFSWQ